MQRCFSASKTQENGSVLSALLRSAGGTAGGWHVATVNMSTNLRMKKRGNVPPRLLTLQTPYISTRPSFYTQVDSY